MTATETELLVEKFGPAVDNPDTTAECVSIMRIFSLSVEELSFKWESYVLASGDNDLAVTIDNLREFQNYLQKQLEEQAKSKRVKVNNGRVAPSPAAINSRTRTPGSASSFLDSMLATPAPSNRKKSSATSSMAISTPSHHKTPSRTPFNNSISSNVSSSPLDASISTTTTPPKMSQQTPYNHRNDSGKIVETLNPDLQKFQRIPPKESRVKLAMNINVKKFDYRTMFQKLIEASEYLDQQINEFTEIIEKEYKVEVGNASKVSQSEIVVVGRIVSESQEEDKANARSLMLECSRVSAAGMKAKLNLSGLQDFSLFSGQIVALKGQNPTGNEFVVKSILELPLLPSAATTKPDLEKIVTRQADQPVSIIAASGPFTLSSNIDYEPLAELVQRINEDAPDAVILLGPFIDISHPLIASGDFKLTDPTTGQEIENATLETIFKLKVLPLLLSIQDPNCLVILIPHVRDAISNHAAFPQHQFDRKSLGLPKNFKCIPNPSTFSLNESVMTAASIDSIQDIIRASISRGSLATNAIRVAFEQILSQRQIYPVFPGSTSFPAISQRTGVNIDIPYLGLSRISNALPDILISPSILKHTTQVVRNVIVINPGFLAKNNSGGTFARLIINPPDPDLLDHESDVIVHSLWERTKIDIIKI